MVLVTAAALGLWLIIVAATAYATWGFHPILWWLSVGFVFFYFMYVAVGFISDVKEGASDLFERTIKRMIPLF